jgi:hypothetical protein
MQLRIAVWTDDTRDTIPDTDFGQIILLIVSARE